MQQSSHIGNARREERMLLTALIELRSEYGEDTLTADGLDVSLSGLAVRAAFVPEVGTRLYCQFRCPPRDDAVHALGEVVWSTWDEPLAGCFGLRFLELDTKSATAIRRYLESDPRELEQPAQSRSAMMRIDGLDAPIEADVKLLEKDCVILEQELGFLRLGRGIEVDVPGRDRRRGRIASIELRQGPLDTPTLVFGVLFDEARQTASQPVARVAPAPAREREQPRSVRAADEPQLVRYAEPPLAAEPEEPDDDLEVRLLQNRLSGGLRWLSGRFEAVRTQLRSQFSPGLRGLLTPLAAVRGVWASYAMQARTQLSRLRYLFAAQWSKLVQRRFHARRRTTAPGLRVQKAGGPLRAQRAERPAPRRIGRFVTVGLALAGVGLGVYALAPRSGADRIRLRPRAPELAETALGAPAVTLSKPNAAPAQQPGTAKPGAGSPVAAGAPPGPVVVVPRFGEPSIANGRSFVLRMSGPVQALEGEGREDGFTVRIPGRLALDRASPIATSHRAVARALILNRGEYAELTVEFLPGMHPKYQVLGKGNAIEVTLERP
jgi:hypothetical protein